MKDITGLKLPEDIRYSENHEWAKEVDGNIRVGLDDYAQDQLGEIVYVELPEVGDEVKQGDDLGSVESVKAVSMIYAPVSGEIIAINDELEDAPELVNESCYGQGWIAEIKTDSPEELDSLMDAADYLDSLKG